MPPLQTGGVQNNSVQMLAAMRDNLRSNENSTTVGTEHLHGRAAGLKVIVVGDSISQGREGDFTWRYRIWEWFQSQGVAVDFVGPYTGTVQPEKPAPPSPPALYGEPQPTGAIKVSGGYAKEVSSGFPKNHFAVWGRAAAVDKGLIKEVMEAHPADLMLLLLGFNDMGWFYSDSMGTLDSIHTLISNARAANPNIKFAIANVPQRSFIGGREDLPVSTNIYNSLLRDTIPEWSTTASPIHLVELEENYNCQPSSCPVGSDGLHPNAMGEYQIARAFSQTLVKDFKIGSSALSIPSDVPTRPLPVPSNFKVFTSPGGVTATWDPVYGAYNYDVRSKIKGGITNFSPGSVSSNRWDATWPIDGWEYEVQVRASAGDTIKGDWTTTLTATAHPQTAEAPQNVIVSATTTGFDISWDPPKGAYSDSIIEYNVIYWDKDAECDFVTGAAFKGTSAHINGLVTGHRYFVAVETWNAAGEGFPAVVRSVIPGAGTPPPPTDLKIIAADPTTAHLTWDSLSAAAGYRLWSRNVNAAGSKLEALNYTVEAACSDQFYLFPGTWNYEWCVSAFNGNAESAKGKCVLAPSPDKDGGTAPTCPLAPQWCPNGGGVGGGSGGGGGGGGDGGGGSGGGGGGSSGGTTEEPWPSMDVLDPAAEMVSVWRTTASRPAAWGVTVEKMESVLATIVLAWAVLDPIVERMVSAPVRIVGKGHVVAADVPTGFAPAANVRVMMAVSARTATTVLARETAAAAARARTVVMATAPATIALDARGLTVITANVLVRIAMVARVGIAIMGTVRESTAAAVLDRTVSCLMARAVARESIAPAAQVWVVPASDWAVAAVGRNAAAVLVSGGCSGGGGGGGGDDDDPSCSIKETATICAEYCTVTTNAAAATTTSCTSTTCMPTVGCSVTGTTTSTITSTSSADCPFATDIGTDNCKPCAWAFDTVSDLDTEGNLRIREGFQPVYATITARAIAPPHAGLVKRAPARTSTALGGCNFKAGVSVTIPAYKGPQNYVHSAIAGELPVSLSMSRWYSKTTVDCAPATTMISDGQIQPFLGNVIQSPTIEHCYELNWMDGFWKYLFTEQHYSCDDFNKLMFDGCNILQAVYDSLPGDEHWDFVGVTQELNSIKALIGGEYQETIVRQSANARKRTIVPQKPWTASEAIIRERMGVLEKIVLGCDLWTSSAIFGPLDSTNYRIYSALKDIDAGLAATYRFWMTNIRIPQQMAAGSEQAALLITSIETGLNTATGKAMETEDGAKRLSEYRKALQAIRERYHLDGTGNVCNKPINLNWNGATTDGAPIARRDSCPLPITTKNPTSPTGTPTSPTGTSTAPTKTTTSLSIPTTTKSSDPIYCFNEHNDDSYVPFEIAGAQAAIEALCNNGNSLMPGGPPYTYVYSDPYGINVIASVQWAPDQSGCKPEKEVEMKTHCESYMEHALSECRSPTEGYGGAFIENQGLGCIQWMLYARKGKGQCSCNESGCTPDSPACCANGSCGMSNALMSARMKLISLDEVDPALSLSLNTKSIMDD
ncbi:contactin [Aspergillus udagawae]|nr:contactin [Aspergillus udagawae]